MGYVYFVEEYIAGEKIEAGRLLIGYKMYMMPAERQCFS